MGQQQEVDAGRVKAEIISVFLVKLATALIQAAVNQDSAVGTFDQMAGAGHPAVCAVR